MNACNQRCDQGRTCDCVANSEYASSTQVPGNPAMQRGPMTENECRGMLNSMLPTRDESPMPITPEGDDWEEIDDDYELGFVEVLCGVGALVLICMLIGFYWGSK